MNISIKNRTMKISKISTNFIFFHEYFISSLPTSSIWYLGPIRPTIPKGSSIDTVAYQRSVSQTDRQTDQLTDRMTITETDLYQRPLYARC